MLDPLHVPSPSSNPGGFAVWVTWAIFTTAVAVLLILALGCGIVAAVTALKERLAWARFAQRMAGGPGGQGVFTRVAWIDIILRMIRPHAPQGPPPVWSPPTPPSPIVVIEAPPPGYETLARRGLVGLCPPGEEGKIPPLSDPGTLETPF